MPCGNECCKKSYYCKSQCCKSYYCQQDCCNESYKKKQCDKSHLCKCKSKKDICPHHHHDHIGSFHGHRFFRDNQHSDRNQYIEENKCSCKNGPNQLRSILVICGDGFHEYPIDGSKAMYINRYGFY